MSCYITELMNEFLFLKYILKAGKYRCLNVYDQSHCPKDSDNQCHNDGDCRAYHHGYKQKAVYKCCQTSSCHKSCDRK